MSSDPFQPHDAPGPSDGAASIHAVTSAMMDHAAHAAAELADGVAHGTVALPDPEPDPVTPPHDEVAAPIAESVAQAFAAVGDTLPAVEGGTGAVLAVPTDAFALYNAKVLAFAQSNMAATGDLFAALMEVRSLPQAMALNADHLRRQMDAMTTQGRELAALAQKLALESLQPFRDVIAPGSRAG